MPRHDAVTTVGITAPSSRGRFNLSLGVLTFLATWSPLRDYGSSEFLELFRYALYSVTGTYVILRYGRFNYLNNIFKNWTIYWFSLLFLLFFLSALWSDDTINSIIRVIFLAITFISSAVVVMSMDKQDILATLTITFVLYIAAGALIAIAIPSIGVEHSYQHNGKWKGLSGQKNPFGAHAMVALLLLFSSRKNLPKFMAGSLCYWPCVFLCALSLYMTESRGALADLLIFMFLLFFIRHMKRFHSVSIAFIILMLPAAIFLTLSELTIIGTKVSLFNVEFDTNNRVVIWDYALNSLVGHEILGFGFGGFWNTERTEAFQSMFGWVLPNFHNGYISVVIESGAVGTILFTMFVLSLLRFIVVNFNNIEKSLATFPFIYIVTFFAHNMYENTITRSTNVLFFLFCTSVFALVKWVPDYSKDAEAKLKQSSIPLRLRHRG